MQGKDSGALPLVEPLQRKETSGVTITSLMPDLTESGFFARAKVDPASLTAREPKADPATVARAGYEAMLAGKDHVVAPALTGKVKVAVARLLPEKLVTKRRGRIRRARPCVPAALLRGAPLRVKREFA